jgi:hypothetical protein
METLTVTIDKVEKYLGKKWKMAVAEKVCHLGDVTKIPLAVLWGLGIGLEEMRFSLLYARPRWDSKLLLAEASLETMKTASPNAKNVVWACKELQCLKALKRPISAKEELEGASLDQIAYGMECSNRIEKLLDMVYSFGTINLNPGEGGQKAQEYDLHRLLREYTER